MGHTDGGTITITEKKYNTIDVGQYLRQHAPLKRGIQRRVTRNVTYLGEREQSHHVLTKVGRKSVFLTKASRSSSTLDIMTFDTDNTNELTKVGRQMRTPEKSIQC